MKKLSVDQIDASAGIRENLGDLQPLRASVNKHGLYRPFIVTNQGKLICNHRLLQAAKEEGIENVPVVTSAVEDAVAQLELQLQDNLHRPYSPSERVKAARLLLPSYSERAKARQGSRTDLHPGNFPKGEDGEALDRIARLLGVSRKTLAREMAVCEAAEADPDTFGELREKMDQTGRVNGLYKEMVLRRKQQEKQRRYAEAPDDTWVLKSDFRDQIERQDFIPDGSAGLIFTDAIYLEKYLHLYGELARFGAAKLQPGAFLLTYYWGKYTERVFSMMIPHLKLFWVGGVYMKKAVPYRPLNINSRLKLLLVYRKPPLEEIWWSPFEDVVSGGKAKDNHEWEQPVEEAVHFIKALCPPGGIVVDPMAGSGTTLVAAKQLGFPYRGIEIDADRVKMIQGRLAETTAMAVAGDHLSTISNGTSNDNDQEAA